jgi:predicted lipid-binding transport protein (Tim44 family)
MGRLELGLIVTCVATLVIAGCTSPLGTGPGTQAPVATPSVPATGTAPDPEAALREYFYAFNFVDDAALSRLLSRRVIDTVGKAAIHNTASDFSGRNYISFTDYTVLKKTREGNSATITVEIGENHQGVRETSTRTIPFVFEDGTWKLDEFVIPG